MRRQQDSKVPPYFLLAVCSTLALSACTKKSGGEVEATSGQAPSEPSRAATSPAPDPEATPGPDGRPPALAVVLPHDKGVVFGHFLIPNGAQLLAETKQQLMIPAYKGFLDEAALRSLASLQLPEKNKPLAQNIDIAAPFGCALVDVKTYTEGPVSCTFGYKGGVDQLVADLGDADKQADAGTHRAKYRFEGRDVFLDGLGNHVVVSAYDDLFDKTKVYLQANLIERGDSIRGDFEIVGYAAEAFDFYRADIQPFLDDYAQTQQSSLASSGHPGVDAALGVWTDYNKKSTQQSIQSLSEMAQLTLYVGVERIGIVAGMAMVPAPGSKLEATSKRAGGVRLDPSLTVAAPEGTIFLVSTATRPDTFDDPNSAEARGVASKSWAALTKQDASAADQALAEFLNEYRDTYTGHSMMAFVDVEQSPLAGIMLAADLREGKAARESFKGFARKFTPDAVLGQEFSQYVSWQFDFDATEIDGVKVDRFTIEPSPKARDMLERELTEKDRQQVDTWLGGMRLIAHRTELSDRVIWTMAPKAEEIFTKQVIAAQNGQGSLVGTSGIQRILAHSPAASAAFGLDLRRTLSWLRGFPEIAREMEQVPREVGNDLSDVFASMQSRSDGIFVSELVVSQPLIDQVRDAAAERTR